MPNYSHADELQRTQPPLSRLEYLVRQLGEWANLNPALRSLHSEFVTIHRQLAEAGAGSLLAELGSDPYRKLTPGERIEARHWLQVLSEHARSARNAMDPASGTLKITVAAWESQWRELTKDLDAYTGRVRENRPAAGGVQDRNT